MKLKRALFKSALEAGPEAIVFAKEGRRTFLQTVREIVTVRRSSRSFAPWPTR